MRRKFHVKADNPTDISQFRSKQRRDPRRTFLNSFGGNTGETFAHPLGTAPVYADSAGTNGTIWLTFDNVTFYQTQ